MPRPARPAGRQYRPRPQGWQAFYVLFQRFGSPDAGRAAILAAARPEVTMKTRTALLIWLVGLVLPAVAGCTGGVYVQYPLFPDHTCATCAGASR